VNLPAKILVGTLVTFVIYLALSLPAVLNYYQPENYVLINGKKYTEEDLKKSANSNYRSIRKQYIDNLRQVFNNFAEEEIVNLEAKSEGVSSEELLSKGIGNYKPTEEEVYNIYETYKNRLGGRSLEESRPMITEFLISQKKQEFHSKIREKYNVKVVTEKPERQKVEVKNNPSLGPENAKVTVIEFSDFECPFCQRSQEVNKALREKYKDKIRWVFRDYPLPFHQNAMYAHIAANCSIQQGKYWDYFQVLFQNTGNLTKQNVIALAEKVGLDKNQLEECAKDKDGSIEKEIMMDINDGQKVGVNGTPAFFINGISVEGAQPYSVFEAIIEQELNQ
jgi:protein-disulfide isomerase